MKKLFLIIFISLFYQLANAGVNDIGSGGIESQRLEKLKSTLVNAIKEKKGKNIILYLSSGSNGWSWQWDSYKKLNDKAHTKTYKKCLKRAKKDTGEDCYLFAINDKIVWKNYDEPVVKKNIENIKLSELPIGDRVIAISLEEDRKQGRFFEDQPDVNNDYQIHIIYTLFKDSKDKEGDINGQLKELIKYADDWTYKTTKKSNKNSKTMNGEGQRIKWDKRKDGKLDISFVRLAITKKEMKKCAGRSGSCGNFFDRTIVNSGFNNPKKIYFNFGDYTYSEWPYSAGFPTFNIFGKHMEYKLKKSEFGYFALHEALHAMGGIFACSPKHFEGHNTRKTSDMMSREGDGKNLTLDPKNDDYWGHNNTSCPDLQDSVYFTPTSDTPYDPFELLCLPKEKWQLTKHDYKNFENRSMCFYSRQDVTAPWEKELGIFQK